MGLLRKAMFGAALFGAYKYFDSLFRTGTRGNRDGLRAVFSTRAQADLAVERLVQEHRVDRSFIYIGPVGDRNSAGTEVSGGDHASGLPGSGDRADGALHGTIEVTVPLGVVDRATLTHALRETGATSIEAF